MNYWLMKSEPTCFSIDDLAQCAQQTDFWDGIRNYQVRNMIRDEMHQGDQAFFYHSSCPQPAVMGTMNIVSEAYPDDTAFDPDEDHFDPKSNPEAPRWFGVDVQLNHIFAHPVLLRDLRQQPMLTDMKLLQKGNRLSITPITSEHWAVIHDMAATHTKSK